MRKVTAMGALAAFLCQTMSPVWGLGLSTPFGLVTIENLQPGETYNTRELANTPLSITNTSDVTVEIKIEVWAPEPKNYPGMKDAGFEPVPDVSWVGLSNPELKVPPGQSVATDVMIRIPNDDSYLGKRYQVQLQSRTVGTGMVSAGLNSTLRFTVAPRRSTPEELALRKKVEGLKAVEFDLLPRVVELRDVEPGKKVKLDFKISNTNNEDLLFFLQSVTPRDVQMTAGRKAEEPPDPGLLAVPKKPVKVRGNTIQSFQAVLEPPDGPEHRGKTYIFLMKVELPGVTTVVSQVARIYVTMRN